MLPALLLQLSILSPGTGIAIVEHRIPCPAHGIYFPESPLAGPIMEEPVVVVNANVEQCQELCAVLEQEHFRTTALHSLMPLGEKVKEGNCRVVILDLDSLPVDNFLFRSLKRKNPGVHIVGLSSRPFHPELEEAMSRHISSCLSKPVDVEELVYWIKSICQG